jgi:peptide/nickel transport system permease protein
MPPLARFLLRRLLAVPVTLLLMTATLYAITMLAPPELRAQLYLTRTEQMRGNVLELTERAIERHGLRDPYPQQYLRWLGRLFQGDWGYSPTLRSEVLPALLARSPTTVELTLYTLLAFIPAGLASGVLAGARHDQPPDHGFRLTAFVATAVPPFVLGLVLLTVFYAGLRWLPPERLSPEYSQVVRSADFHNVTGLLTIDGLLNGRADVTVDAFRHLLLPVLTLGLAHWATLGRVTRVTMIDELQREYIVAARARGLRAGSILWRHAFPNVAGPSLTSSALAAAALITGVFVVEIVFGLHGVSEVITRWANDPFARLRVPDTAAIVGFAVYSVVAVQAIMVVLDVVQAFLDPRLREAIADG